MDFLKKAASQFSESNSNSNSNNENNNNNQNSSSSNSNEQNNNNQQQNATVDGSKPTTDNAPNTAQSSDYGDKAFGFAAKKAGFNVDEKTGEQITDGLRSAYESYSGKKVDSKYSN